MPACEVETRAATGAAPAAVARTNDTEARLAYAVGGIEVGLFAPPDIRLTLERELMPFRVSPKRLDVRIDVEWTESLSKPATAPAFHSGGLWSLYEQDCGFRFYFATPFLGATPYKAAWFDYDFRRGQISLFKPYYPASRKVNALEYPLDELLAIHRLSRGEGIEVHAVGIVDARGRGQLFLGHSGAGKSTSARLWQKQPGVRVLSDDRIILRFVNGRARMFGTPWHGDAGIALAESADLFAMYILEHGAQNELRPMAQSRAAAELLARSFVPHHSAEGMRAALEIAERLTREIPCSLFRFVPDQSAAEMIAHV